MVFSVLGDFYNVFVCWGVRVDGCDASSVEKGFFYVSELRGGFKC